MLWVLLFIAGLLVLLAGIMSLILRGPRLANTMLATLGLVALVAGAGGVILKPRLPGIAIAGLPAPSPAMPEPVAVAPAPQAEATPAPEPTPAVTHPPPAESPATSSKDESQLVPPKLPAPLSVTTTTVVGNETDPLSEPAATPPTATAAPAAPEPAPAAPAPPTDEQKLAALAPQQPRDETGFTKAVSDARTAYDKAGDDDRGALQSSRAAAICAAVKKPDVQGWVGAVKEIDRDPGGRTIVSIALPDGTLVKTWNNAMSDIEDKTLILAGTPLAAAVGKLAVGDPVRFSGTFFSDEPDCYRSSRLSFDQSMHEPSFLFRFTALEKLS